jgi:hypothetical protein
LLIYYGHTEKEDEMNSSDKPFEDEDFLLQARPMRQRIVVPDDTWSEILPGLWQGGTDDWDTVQEFRRSSRARITDKEFDTVITVYAWANPCDWEVKELRYGYYDSDRADWEKDVDFETIFQLVDVAYQDWKAGKTVLIRCQAGLNRSGLLMALVLMKDGYSAVEAIDLIRKMRSEWALCNENFVKWLIERDNPTGRID